MIYYWASGQDDNLGDSVLRRRMLADLQSAGPVCVHVGQASPDFREALGIRSDDTVFTKYLAFCLSSLRAAFGSKFIFAFDPGEVAINRKSAIMHAMLLPTLMLARLRGGRVVRIGVGIARSSRLWSVPVLLSVRLSSLNIWRDQESRNWAASGQVYPDWAFDTVLAEEAPVHIANRSLLALTFRGDGGDLSESVICALREVAQQQNLEPVVVVQVRRDSAAMRRLAERIGCRCVDWDNTDSHRDQERKVLDIYSLSHLVVSDRLHALILATRTGSLVAGLMEHPDRKIGRHFQSAGFDALSRDVSGHSSDQIIDFIASVLASAESQRAASANARAKVGELRGIVFGNQNPIGRIDFMAGGLRISLAATTNTPGPRTHIVSFTNALKNIGVDTKIVLASNLPFLGRFSQIRQSDFAQASRRKLLVADCVRLAAGVWTGFCVFVISSRRGNVDVIYERTAVFQSMTSFHRSKRRAVRVVEANGVLARETSGDRNGLVLVGVAEYLEKRTLRRADLVVCVSEALKGEIVEYAGIPNEAVLVVPNAADKSILELEPSRGGTSYVIGFVGSVVKWQSLDELIRTASRLRADGGDLRVEIIGDGPELSRLRALASELDMSEHVEFLGKLAPADVFARMSSWNCGFAGHRKSTSDVMYHSPLKLYEYGAAGLDIVCTKSDDALSLAEAGVRMEIVDGSAQDLHRALADLMKMPVLSEGEIRGLRATLAASHSWEERAARVLDYARTARQPNRSFSSSGDHNDLAGVGR